MRRRRVLRVLLVAVVALLVLVAIAPTLAGIGPVRRWVEGKLAASLGRPVALAELEAGWTRGVALHGLSVANRGAEFGEDALLEVASVSITDPLTQLLFGGGPTRVVIDGLAVRVEEQAGGRTNVDDLFERLTAPRPPAAPTAEPSPPLQLELRHCTLRFRRLPYRAPPRRVDPFEEDAVIRDATEGALQVGIERFDLTVAGGLQRQAIRFAGGVTVNGKGGHIAGSIEIAGKDISGEAQADDLDLEMLQPFVPFDLRGKLDLKVDGDIAEGLDLALRVEGFHLAGEKLPTVTEEWVDLSAAVRRTEEGVAVEELGMKTASGEVELEAGGSWPLAEGAPFHVRTRVPSRLLFAAAAREPLRTTFHLAVEGTGTPEDLDVVGTLSMPKVELLAPELAKLGEGSGNLEFDIGLHDRRIEIRRFLLQGLRLDAKLGGTVLVAPGEPPAIDLAGKAAIDLALLHHLLEPFLDLPPAAEIQGWLRTSDLIVRLDEKRNAEVRADAVVDGLLVAGVFDQTLRRDHAEAHIDAALTDDGNVLEVRRAALDDLHAVGRVAGLNERKLRHAEGEIKGSLVLAATPLHIAGIEEIDALTGKLAVDLMARTHEGCVKVEGSASIDRLVAESNGLVARCKSASFAGSAACDAEGRWETSGDARLEELKAAGSFGEIGATVTVAGGARDEGSSKRAEAKATLEAVHAVGGFGEYQRDRLDLEGWLGEVDGKLNGDAALRGELFTVTAQLQDSERARLTVAVEDLDRLNLALPADLELDGPLRVDGTVQREGGVWSFLGGVNSGELTVRWHDRGLRGEPLALTFRGRQQQGGWAIEVPSLKAERSRASVQVMDGFVGRDGSLAAKLRLELALDLLASIVPDLAPLELRGALETTAVVKHDREWSVDVDSRAKGVSARTEEGRRTPAYDGRVHARASLGDGELVLDPVELQADKAELKGTGRWAADVFELTLDGSGPVAVLSPFLPVKGKGDFGIRGLSIRLADDGPVHVEGILSAAELQIHEADLLRPRAVLKVDGRRDSAGVRDLRSDIRITAVKGHVDTVTAHGLDIHERGRGELLFGGGGEGYRINAVVKQQTLVVDQVKWNKVTLTLGGLVRKEPQKRVDFSGLTGDLAFEHWQLGPLPFTDATCKVRFHEGMVALNGIRAKYSQGDVTGDAKLWPRGTDVKWWTHLAGRDIQLSEDLGDPLSFLVPILRVNRKDKQGRLTGKFHPDFVLKCEGTTNKLLQETMNGYGSVDFDDIEVHNSVLLPLLGLRIDKLLLNRPYRFKDLHVDFKLTDGLLKPKRFKLKGHPFGIEIWGEANLRGTLDFVVATPTLFVPMRVSGPFDSPSVRVAPGARLRKDK